MDEKSLLSAVVAAKDPRERHRAADILIGRLSNGHNPSFDALHSLDGILKKDIWRAVKKDEALQYKIQTIAILVDMRMVRRSWEIHGKPRSMDTGRLRRTESGNWSMSGRLRMG